MTRGLLASPAARLWWTLGLVAGVLYHGLTGVRLLRNPVLICDGPGNRAIARWIVESCAFKGPGWTAAIVFAIAALMLAALLWPRWKRRPRAVARAYAAAPKWKRPRRAVRAGRRR